MTQSKFKALKAGDTVTLAVDRPVYGTFPKIGKLYVPAGEKGIVASVDVPAVTANRKFACVDFPHDQKLVDMFGVITERPNPHQNKNRVAVYAEELE